MVGIQTLALGVFGLLTVGSWEDVSWKVHQLFTGVVQHGFQIL